MGTCPKWVISFTQKSLDMGPILVLKIIKSESCFVKIAKIAKIAVFEEENHLEVCINLQKQNKKLKISHFFR